MKAVFEKFPNAAITCDVVVYNEDTHSILIGLRKSEPYKGHWALPGGHFNPYDFEGTKMDMSLVDAAKRELKEETNLDLNKASLVFLGYYDDPWRVPTKRAINFAFYVFIENKDIVNLKAGDDIKELKWVSPLHPFELAFDHEKVVNDFVFANGAYFRI